MLDFTAAAETASSGLFLPVRQENQYQDRHRPAYHFLPPANWMNDPNGLIYWNNQYHLFYQYNPNGAFWGTIHWGHAVSDDLIHWRDLPLALAPTPNSPDADGCWSGCAVNYQGIPTLVYTGVNGDLQLPCIATSVDGLESWQKYNNNPVLASLPTGLDLVAFRDPAIWREGQEWYMVMGSGIREVGGTALLFHSTNLTDWEYLHPLTTGDVSRFEPVWSGSLWECPQLITLGNKYLLTFGVWHQKPRYTLGQVGTYTNQRFNPETEFKLDYGDDYFYAPQTLVEPDGRAIMWGWIQEGRSEAAQIAAGWAGVMSLPRILSIRPDGKLGTKPAPELKTLRRFEHKFEQISLAPDSEFVLAGVQGDCLEIMTEFILEENNRISMAILMSPDGEEQTVISYDQVRGWLEVDTSRSSSDLTVKKGSYGGFLPLNSGEKLQLHIFVDRSVIEVFANEVNCITTRVYPTRPDSLGISLAVAGENNVEVTHLNVWELNSIW